MFLDLDGTLFDLREHPDDVRADEAARQLLRSLAERLSGRLALVSGRSVADIDRVLGARLPIAVAGSHGLEMRLADGRLLEAGGAPPSPDTIAALEAFAAGHSGLFVERKTLGAALHYRQAPELEQEAVALARSLADAGGRRQGHRNHYPSRAGADARLPATVPG
jgi:trehalose 6-phosphate phosphatase